MSAVLSAHSEEGYAAARTSVQAVLQAGHAVLVVGGPPGTFGEKLHRRKDVTFWSASQPSPNDRVVRRIPLGVHVVLVTRFCSADLVKSVVTACKAQGVTCFTQVNSRSAVERIFANEPFEEEEPMPTTPAPRLAQPAPVRPSAPAPAQPPTLSAETAREVEQLRKTDRVAEFCRLVSERLERDYWGLISPDSFRNVAEGLLTPDADLWADKLSNDKAATEALALRELLLEVFGEFERCSLCGSARAACPGH